MADWAAFTGITGVVLTLLLVLSHLTQSTFSGSSGGTDPGPDPDFDPRSNRERESRDADDPDFETDLGTSSDAADPDPDLLPDADAFDTAGDSEASSRAGGGAERDRNADFASESSRPSDKRPNGGRTAKSGPGLENGPAYGSSRGDGRHRDAIDPGDLSTGALLANVALSQGLFALVLLGAVLYTEIPAHALGIEFSVAYLRQGLVLGAGTGLALYVANELGAAAATRLGFDHDEGLRELLAPDSPVGWLILLVAVLPIIAGFEELLFRAAVIGVVSTGFGVSPWVLAVVSSLAFAVGHGMQGSVGIVVTGLLGFALAAIFIVTGSFLAVVVAHYLVNALEFAVHEGFDFEWASALER